MTQTSFKTWVEALEYSGGRFVVHVDEARYQLQLVQGNVWRFNPIQD